ncbi:MAG: hypothetical protein DMF56_25420 [Acidobacteria bacterium]|nr:MAG: hypothetical protein DMF56_25420 [Acidobacteriota bacterium]
MHSDQQPYRSLKEAMQEYEGADLYAGVVRPWMRGQDAERRWMEDFSKRQGSPVPRATIEEIWRLYAFSRIVEMLQLDFAPEGRPNPNQWGTFSIGAAQYAEFMDFFGLHKVDAPFCPFFHEIVTVETANDRTAPITQSSRATSRTVRCTRARARGGWPRR